MIGRTLDRQLFLAYGGPFFNHLTAPYLPQPDQINIAVFSGTLELKVYANVQSSVHCTSHVLQGTRKTRPCITGHPAQQSDWELYNFIQWDE